MENERNPGPNTKKKKKKNESNDNGQRVVDQSRALADSEGKQPILARQKNPRRDQKVPVGSLEQSMGLDSQLPSPATGLLHAVIWIRQEAPWAMVYCKTLKKNGCWP